MSRTMLFSELEPEPEKPADRPVELPPDPKMRSPAELWAGLGTSVEEFECFRCSGSFFEVMQQDAGHWHLWCVFCGARQWEPARDREVFVFADGRFRGLTVDQVAVQDGGADYIKFIAQKGRSKQAREKCQKWLDEKSVRT